MAKEKLVLAYSGGLDTSIILHWLINKKGYDVTAFMADLGQEEDFEAAKKKAISLGASDCIIKDVKREFVTDFVYPAVRGNAKYEGRYLLGTSLARPLTAMTQIEVANDIGANIVSHGATGKGNDQVRFEMTYLAKKPGVKIFAPWKDDEFLADFEGRDQLLDYAEKHGIPIVQSSSEPWSSDDNFMHISYEAGILEDPLVVPFERMFNLTVSPQEAPDKETLLDIHFDAGNPVMAREILSYKHNSETGLLDDVEYGSEAMDPVGLFGYLNSLAGQNGVGREDIVESRYVGMKSRGVYETPAGTILHLAHQDLEGITLDREIIKMNQHLSIDLAERIYSGYWFSPEREAMQAAIDHSQENVTGKVRVGLYKGNVIARGRDSPFSLYDEKIASMHEEGGYDQRDAKGFIRINALRLRLNEQRDMRK